MLSVMERELFLVGCRNGTDERSSLKAPESGFSINNQNSTIDNFGTSHFSPIRREVGPLDTPISR
jgi:hypothetical protein